MLSGKFVLRLDPHLHKELKAEARRQNESLNSFCISRLKQSQKNSPVDSSLLNAILEEFNPLGVIVFGSVVRGDHTEKSDLDLLIVMPSEVRVDRSLYKRWDSIISDAKISPQFSHLPQLDLAIGSLWLETSLEGEILYESSLREVSRVHREIRMQIASGLYQRKFSHGHAYWMRKEEDAK